MVQCHQNHYASRLSPIDPSIMGREPDDTLADKHLHGLYLRLLGGVAWLVMTRGDIAIYVVALQRASHQPTFGAVRRLNKLTIWCKRNPLTLTYRALGTKLHLLTISDSAFKRESDDDCLAMRGAIIAVGSLNGPVTALEWYARKHKLVTRSTFAAELVGFLDAVDLAFLIALAFFELIRGKASPHDLVRLRQDGSELPVPW